MEAAGALAELLKPVKMNYQIHANTIPHLHLHLYPRFRTIHTLACRSTRARRVSLGPPTISGE